MKLVNRRPVETAGASAARGTAWRELRFLVLLLAALAAVVYFAVGAAVDFAVGRISYETEQRLFGSFDVGAALDRGGHASLARPERILKRLSGDPDVPPLSYRLVSIDAREPNAVAFPGGTIGVTSGLLNTLDDEVALAFVLGHELGHFRHRDHLRGIGRAAGVGLLYAFLFHGEMGSRSMDVVLRNVLDRSYSRDREDAADRFAVALVDRTYGKTRGIDRLFRLLRDADHLPRWAYMFTTHPSPAARIANLRRYAAELTRSAPTGPPAPAR